MTPEIKKRIEQIKSGKIPKGYKRTRAGIMPCDWCIQKEYKAKDVFCSVSNKNHNGDYEVLSATQDRGVIPRSQVDIDIKYDETNTDGYKKVDKGDFVISLRSFQGGIEYSEYTGLVSPAYTVLKPKVPICDGYYKSYFKTNDFISRLSKGTYGIRDGKQVGFKDFGEMIIHFPPLPEQEKIAKILSTQDKVIECYEKKIEQLKQIKKYYLQNMFPKRGETVPKIRFKGFTDAWEQRKLIDCFYFLQNNTLSRAALQHGHGAAINVHYGDILVKFGEYLDIDSESMSYIPNQSFVDKFKGSLLADGDIIMADTAEDESVGKFSEIVGLHGKAALSGLHTIPLRPLKKFASGFLGYYMNSSVYHDQLLPLMQGIKVTSISKNAIKGTKIYYPNNLMEQASIGQFFILLDNLITLHQRKLEEEKQKKKSLTQLLLSGIVRV